MSCISHPQLLFILLQINFVVIFEILEKLIVCHNSLIDILLICEH